MPPTPGRSRRRGAFSVIDTTEIRWFALGPLPTAIGVWFSGSIGVTEQRCDTYLLDGRRDVGVKRRSGETLELKIRQSIEGRIRLTEGLSGSTEVWRKWSPADGIVEKATDGSWVDVHKSITKRRFSADGAEVAFTSDPCMTGAGCDIEVAGVAVGAVQAWTVSLAAFGPPTTRRDSLLRSWRSIVTGPPCPEPIGRRTGRAMGYPEWLMLTVSPDPDEPGGHGQQAARGC